MNYDVVTLVMHDDAQLHVISTKSFSICNITVVTLTYVCIYVSKSFFVKSLYQVTDEHLQHCGCFQRV